MAEIEEKGGTSEIKRLMSENVGKVLIETNAKPLKLGDDEFEDIRVFLLEISKRGGRVAVEKLYIAIRGLEFPEPPLLKDVGLVGWNVFQRIYRAIYYRHTNEYNAKVLYHPGTGNIVMVYFSHKNYGDLCETVFSTCNEIAYLDEESFDLQLSGALKESLGKNIPVRVNFLQTDANMPQAKLDWDLLKGMNRSVRMYKWILAAQEREVKPVSKSRFIPFQAALTVIDYSLSLYDWVKQALMYKPANSTKAEILYVEDVSDPQIGSQDATSKPRKIHSVVFSPIPPEKNASE
ncbi:hypothetical protein CH373_04010 [Leptospira perolatii]|uniref:Uncharacterized protein n=1 Tax=Leptospira perolatii TaxID=2023191 RepID=A0A2M9ZQT2_9LEPT|nr:hypothetical protein CH360_13320 [Leptospira perolatii]PJZ74447.1 hypothetical protein CH373_04010 [Leptospira perolatii]